MSDRAIFYWDGMPLPMDVQDWHPSDAYDWNLPTYDPTGDPYFEVSDSE